MNRMESNAQVKSSSLKSHMPHGSLYNVLQETKTQKHLSFCNFYKYKCISYICIKHKQVCNIEIFMHIYLLGEKNCSAVITNTVLSYLKCQCWCSSCLTTQKEKQPPVKQRISETIPHIYAYTQHAFIHLHAHIKHIPETMRLSTVHSVFSSQRGPYLHFPP